MTEVATMRACRNCFHVSHAFLVQHWTEVECNHPRLELKETNPVTGTPKKAMDHCSDIREDVRLCGPEGKWWEPSPAYTFVSQLDKRPKALPPPSKGKNLSDFM